eukprot:scaffold42878_cov71-Phaeocystis_antarctica.AAC.2
MSLSSSRPQPSSASTTTRALRRICCHADAPFQQSRTATATESSASTAPKPPAPPPAATVSPPRASGEGQSSVGGAPMPACTCTAVCTFRLRPNAEASIKAVARDVELASTSAQQRHDLGQTLALDVRVDVLLQQVKQQEAAARRGLGHSHPLTLHVKQAGDARREGHGRSADRRR